MPQQPKERPILFSAPMVRAILANSKTQTRRIIKPQPPEGVDLKQYTDLATGAVAWGYQTGTSEPRGDVKYSDGSVRPLAVGLCKVLRCPHGAPGDRLWVKETWRPEIAHHCVEQTCDCADVNVGYAADKSWQHFRDEQIPDEWTMPKAACAGNMVSPLFMPRWASRLTLDICSIRPQRLHDISEADARAEGIARLSKDGGRTYKFGIPDADGLPGHDDHGWHWQDWKLTAREAYAHLWDSINGAGSWASNPWVRAIEFRRLP